MNKENSLLNKQCFRQWHQVNNYPWLTPQSLRVVNLILLSYKNAYKKSLLDHPKQNYSQLDLGSLLFNMKNPIIAHDSCEEPTLIYANAIALQLWHRCWKEMIGMPSRLTAPITEQVKRQRALNAIRTTNAIKGYEGIRVDSQGNLFTIKNVLIWNLWDEDNQIFGQAATFDKWSKV